MCVSLHRLIKYSLVRIMILTWFLLYQKGTLSTKKTPGRTQLNILLSSKIWNILCYKLNTATIGELTNQTVHGRYTLKGEEDKWKARYLFLCLLLREINHHICMQLIQMETWGIFRKTQDNKTKMVFSFENLKFLKIFQAHYSIFINTL